MARRKLWDLRLATDPDTRDLRPGQVIKGVQSSSDGRLVAGVRITSRRHFGSMAEAYIALQKEGMAERLLPPEYFFRDESDAPPNRSMRLR